MNARILSDFALYVNRIARSRPLFGLAEFRRFTSTIALRMRAVIPLVLAAWAVFALPFIAAGPDDLEEFFTGVASTRIAVGALLEGSLPFWTADMALGLPQPLRFHFVTHPLAPLCAVADCHQVLRLIASLHVLAGALVTALLVHRLTGRVAAAAAAGATLIGASSTIQPTLVDDWPITAINEASLPLLVLAVTGLVSAGRPRAKYRWALALGGLAGLLLSMSFPVVVLLLTAVVALARPSLVTANWRWVFLAAAIAIAIGAGQIYHLFDQVEAASPATIRSDHEEPPLAVTLWSTFVRPFAPSDTTSWRTVFFGPPFALAAVLASLLARDPRLWPFRIGFFASVLGLVLPEWVLFDLITTRWAYRTGVIFFGIVLAAWAVHRIAERGGLARLGAAGTLAMQCLAVTLAAWPAWRPVAAAALTPGAQGERRLATTGDLAVRLAAIHRRAPGRFMFTERAYAAMRELRLARFGLAPNQLPMLGVPTLNVVAYGLSLDALFPNTALLVGNTPPSDAAAASAAYRRTLGIRYLVSTADEPVPGDLEPIASFDPGLRVLEERDAWPEGFFVSRLPANPVPRLPGCPHDGYLCADVGQYALGRIAGEPLSIEPHADGVTLRFAPRDVVRSILLTYWWQPAWHVTSGRARVSRAAEQLTGVTVEPGESEVRLRYFPPLRGTLFLTGLAAELLVLGALAVSALRRGTPV